MLVGFVLSVVKTALLENIVTNRVTPVHLVKIVHFNVHKIAMEHVDI